MVSKNPNQLSIEPPKVEGFTPPLTSDIHDSDARYNARTESLEAERDRRRSEASADMQAGLRIAPEAVTVGDSSLDKRGKTYELPGRGKGRVNGLQPPTNTELLSGMTDAEIAARADSIREGRALATKVALYDRTQKILHPESAPEKPDRAQDTDWISPEIRQAILRDAIEAGRRGEQ